METFESFSTKKSNTEDFIKRSKIKHGDKYKYDINSFKNSTTKTKITCIKHGDFYQSPESHIRQKSGCNICRESKGESAVFKFLTKHNIKFERYTKIRDEIKNEYCDEKNIKLIRISKLNFLCQ
jgi:hypothetical protein